MSRWGFAGTGRIAATVARELALTDGAEALAVASRDLARARAFADEHGFARAYGSYAELLADDDVDVVYVATPHAQHHAVARRRDRGRQRGARGEVVHGARRRRPTTSSRSPASAACS